MKKIFFVALTILLILGFSCQKTKPVDMSDGSNSVTTTGTSYDEYLNREVPTSTILEVGNGEVLQVYTPLSGQAVLSPLKVYGLAPAPWFFEASFPIKIVDENGKVLGQAPAQAQGEWMKPGLIPFIAYLNFESPLDIKVGKLIFSADNPSGLPQYERSVEMPIKFYPTADTTLVKVFFSNEKMNPNIQDCSLVFPVERLIDKTPAVGQRALELLLAGPYANEKAAGFTTVINSGTRLNSLKIVDGVAYADFDKTLGDKVGGSCLVTMIRAQITETLKQFPTVKSVVISIDGNSEEILQP